MQVGEPSRGPSTVAAAGAAAGGADQRATRLPIDLPLLPALFDNLHVGVVAVDADGVVTAVNPQAERLLGLSQTALLGRPLVDALVLQHADGERVPASERPVVRALREARADEGGGDVVIRGDGTAITLGWASSPMLLAGQVTGAVLAFYDLSAQVSDGQRERLHVRQLQTANARLQLLATTTSVLTETLDVREALDRLAHLCVPTIADWVVVDVLHPGGRLERASLVHRDPAQAELGRARLGDLPNLAAEHTSPLAQVLHGGDTRLLTDFPSPQAAVDPIGQARLELFHLLGVDQAITAPLRARGRTLGALTLVRADVTRAFTDDDLALVDDLAGRAALALDNARQFTEQHSRAEQLQRALLPTLPPCLGGLSLAARYRPATDAAHVGGDWFDAFPLPDGTTALVIGDVAGHDLHAAARMGAIRHKLRALAVDHLHPARALERLDAVLQLLSPDDTATAVLVRVMPAVGGTATIEWSSAGHLPPMLIPRAGPARLLESSPDLALGVQPASRTSRTAEMHPGDSLVLYTDGLVEHRGEHLSDSLERLRTAADLLCAAGPQEQVDALLERLRPAASDDIAVLVATSEFHLGQ